MKTPVPCIALLTDFGTADPYVGIMKGTILSIHPEARIVDVSHEIPPHSVLGAAFQLRSSAEHFPDGTLFVAVVDPGVGTKRKILYAESKRHRFLAPDNGLLTMLKTADRVRSVRSVTSRRHMRSEVSNTFHGRDIFAPVAAWLSRGADPAGLGPPVRGLKKIEWDPVTRGEDGSVRGRVVASDRFGNLITNIPASAILNPKKCVVVLRNRKITGLSRTYDDARPGEAIALIGSTGSLEIAVAGGNARDKLHAFVGDALAVHPAEPESSDFDTVDHVRLLEANLDNSTGESLAAAIEHLFACGALDVWTTPIQMKKSRPGVKLSALAPFHLESQVMEGMLRHTPTFGVRAHGAWRHKLSRRIERVRTKFGPIRVKIGSLDGKAIRAAPEYEDVAAAARRAKVTFDVVHLAASEAGRRFLDV
jgi:S-adenosylmethionine hydrolase